MTTKLALWNLACVELGCGRISDTGERVTAAFELTAVHDQVVGECLSAGSWNFAMETIKAEADTGVTPEFGYRYVFAKPDDWLRTNALSDEEYLQHPLLHYYDDSNYWSADVTPIYVRYVSNDTGLGLDLAAWPPAFTDYVAKSLAQKVAYQVTQNRQLASDMRELATSAKRKALSQDAMNEANPKFPPMGRWNSSRGGTSRFDRGSRGKLIG